MARVGSGASIRSYTANSDCDLYLASDVYPRDPTKMSSNNYESDLFYWVITGNGISRDVALPGKAIKSASKLTSFPIANSPLSSSSSKALPATDTSSYVAPPPSSRHTHAHRHSYMHVSLRSQYSSGPTSSTTSTTTTDTIAASFKTWPKGILKTNPRVENSGSSETQPVMDAADFAMDHGMRSSTGQTYSTHPDADGRHTENHHPGCVTFESCFLFGDAHVKWVIRKYKRMWRRVLMRMKRKLFGNKKQPRS